MATPLKTCATCIFRFVFGTVIHYYSYSVVLVGMIVLLCCLWGVGTVFGSIQNGGHYNSEYPAPTHPCAPCLVNQASLETG